MDDYTDIERLAELQRLEQMIVEAKRRMRDLAGLSSPNGQTNHFGLPAIATLVKGSEITPTNIRWVWEGWLAEGKLEILAGAVSAGADGGVAQGARGRARGVRCGAAADSGDAPGASTCSFRAADGVGLHP